MLRILFGIWELVTTKFLGNLGIVLFTVGLILCLTEVARRYIFKTSFVWGTEIITYCIVFASFFFLGITLKQGGHIRLSLPSRWLPIKGQRALDVLANMAGVFFCGILLSGALALIGATYKSGSTTPNARLPIFLVDIILSLGILLLGLRFVLDMFVTIKELFKPGRKEGGLTET